MLSKHSNVCTLQIFFEGMFLKNFSKLNFGIFLFLFPDHVFEDGAGSCLEINFENYQKCNFKKFSR
jgi:hypothetical protein